MLFQGLRTVIYKVSDIALAKDWYTRALGLAPYFDQPFYVGFSVGGYELGLDPSGSDAETGPGGSVGYWGVADIEAALRHLVSIGAKERSAIQDVGDEIRVAVVSDPFGNSVGIIQNPHFKAD
jgi:predicted enzyme related to lactoylglutathione lyase